MRNKGEMKTKIELKKVLLLIGIIICLVIFIYFFTSTNENVTEMGIKSIFFEKPIACNEDTNAHTTLAVPTQITKIGEDYFIVDCYNNQIITSEVLESPLSEWRVLTGSINRGHTIASDGEVYLADDTENNQVLIFEKVDGLFYITQYFSDIGNRPHCVEYDEDTNQFYVLSSMSGEIYIFVREKDSSQVILEKVVAFPELRTSYVRSLSIIDGDIYLVSGNGSINVVSTRSWEIESSFPVPDELYGMIQVKKIDNYFYITVSTDINGNQDYATILRVKDLEDLEDGNYEIIYDQFLEGGTPYYISTFDGSYFLTEHRVNGIGVWRFDVNEDHIINQEIIFP